MTNSERNGGASAPPPEIDAFLARLPAAQRAALEHLRRVVRDAVPAGVEVIAYGVPAVRYRGRPLVSYGVAGADCSFYVQSPPVLEAHRELLAGWGTGKGTVRFAPDRPLPDDLVRALVAARMAETDADEARRRRR